MRNTVEIVCLKVRANSSISKVKFNVSRAVVNNFGFSFYLCLEI